MQNPPAWLSQKLTALKARADALEANASAPPPDIDHIRARLTSARHELHGARRRVRALFGDGDVRVATLVASWKVAKDHLLAIDVAEQLVSRDPRFRVLLVGQSGSDANPTHYQRGVRTRLAASAAGQFIRCTGERGDALELIAGSDVLFLTSLWEGWPNVVLEAMSLGVPVVSTDVSDVRSVLPFPWQVIPSRNPIEFAEAIVTAAHRRDEIGQLQRAELHAFQIDPVVDRLEQLLSELAS